MVNYNKVFVSFFLLILSSAVFCQWEIQHIDNYSRFNSIKFRSEQEGFLLGDNSKILKTTDGGEHWKQIQPGIDVFFQDFQFLGDTTIIACGFYYTDVSGGSDMQSKVLISNDNGEKWELMSDLPNKQIYAQWFLSKDNGFLIGYNGIYKTKNAGESWVHVKNLSTAIDNKLLFVDDSIGYATDGNTVLKTVNGGDNWVLNYTFDTEITSMNFMNKKLGFIGAREKIYKTINEGIKWEEIAIVYEQAVLSIDFLSENIIFLISSEICPCIPEKTSFHTSISKTIDGGNTWESVSKLGVLYSADFISENIGYVSGQNNIIMKLDGGDYLEFPDNYPWTNVDVEFSEEIIVYPNPGSNHIIIEVKEPVKRIKVISMKGQNIPVNYYNLNENQIFVEIVDLVNGIYTFMLEYDNDYQFYKVIKN